MKLLWHTREPRLLTWPFLILRMNVWNVSFVHVAAALQMYPYVYSKRHQEYGSRIVMMVFALTPPLAQVFLHGLATLVVVWPIACW